jgi:Leucine-rich repeat (LRR) protein
MNGLNLSTWTTVSLPALKRLNIASNDFYQLPSFRSNVSAKTTLAPGGLAPALTHITISDNNMSRATNAAGVRITANEQLNTLPTTLESLEMNGVFSDSTTIDLLDYINLKNFNMNSYYNRNSQRRMTGGTVMPRVTEGALSNIESYQIYNQPYSQMCNGLITGLKLSYLYFPWCGTTQKEGEGPISIASPVIRQFISYGIGHNVPNLSGKVLLTDYVQQYSSPITDSSFEGKFTLCEKLSQLNFYGSGITGSIQTGLQNLPNLTYFEGRFTNISG